MLSATDKKRKEAFDEAVQGRLLMEHAKIVNIPHGMKKDFQLLLEDILKILRYSNEKDMQPLSWPKPMGNGPEDFAIRVKMSYPFWDWFLKTGKRNLYEYNRANGTNIRFIQERNLRNTDRNRLCLYLRHQIKKRYEDAGKKAVQMKIVRDQLVISELGSYDPVVLAMRINADLSEWKGLSMEALMDDRMLKEKESGSLFIGPLSLPGLEDGESIAETRKRGRQPDESVGNNKKASRWDQPSA